MVDLGYLGKKYVVRAAEAAAAVVVVVVVVVVVIVVVEVGDAKLVADAGQVVVIILL